MRRCYVIIRERDVRVNEEIRIAEVRVVDDDNNQLGVMSPREALRLARERDLDLVEIAPTARPPVCRIMDYGKYRYEQSKRGREARKKQKVIEVKEVRGREIVHADLGKKLLERLAETLSEIAVMERAPRVEGRNMIMILAPKQ